MDYKSDPYESAMRNQAVAVDSVFRIQYHSQDRNTPQDKVCFFHFVLYYVGLFSFCSVFSFLEARVLFLFCRLHSMPYIYCVNDRYSLSPRVGSVDVATLSFILELKF